MSTSLPDETVVQRPLLFAYGEDRPEADGGSVHTADPLSGGCRPWAQQPSGKKPKKAVSTGGEDVIAPAFDDSADSAVNGANSQEPNVRRERWRRHIWAIELPLRTACNTTRPVSQCANYCWSMHPGVGMQTCGYSAC